MNLNLHFKVMKYRHLHDNHIYIYQLENKTYGVVMYDEDDDTIVDSYFAVKYGDAIHQFNRYCKEK